MSAVTLLGVSLVILKLTGFIAWAWMWVLAPFWIPAAIALVLGAGILAISAADHADRRRSRRK